MVAPCRAGAFCSRLLQAGTLGSGHHRIGLSRSTTDSDMVYNDQLL